MRKEGNDEGIGAFKNLIHQFSFGYIGEEANKLTYQPRNDFKRRVLSGSRFILVQIFAKHS